MIGRKNEIEELNDIYCSNRAQLVAIYGRRRVGKTFLVDNAFEGRITFQHAGLSPVEALKGTSTSPLKAQLQHFFNSLILYGMEKCDCPTNWLDAFLMLEILLEKKNENHKKQVVFIDELPWMDTQKSGFITAFEGFWNTWGCHRKNLIVVVCGSATSWISDHLINNHGGLYNRLTAEIKLSPFTLAECEQYFMSENIKMSRYDIAQAYMITGGIPYYLSYFKKGKSLPQNIDSLFFAKNAKLKNEFERLFSSVFKSPDTMMAIIRILALKNAGYTRSEIAEKLGHAAGGNLSKALYALVESDFIVKYVPFGYSKRQEHYKLIDPFCMFYLHFVENQTKLNENFWQQNSLLPKVVSWRGFSFENLCFNHIGAIKRKLEIGGVSTEYSAWSKREDDADGMQIDLILERKDNVVNMCEIKYYGNEFTVSKEYYRTLLNRQEILSHAIPRKSIIHNTLITTYGLKENEYSSIFDNVVTLDDLFM
ncbi:MAG: ATP-binding protein [Eubacteriales bacterium]|nr:ATP-binding protein [Eubacteriales bacterium]